jgi:DNA-directed RNA polymerase specialized sigma24 family protein
MSARDVLEKAEPLGRQAVELCYFGGLSASEAAAVLDAAVGDIRRALRTVLLALGRATAAAVEVHR